LKNAASFNDRREESAKAKQALLEKFRARATTDSDPEAAARRQEQIERAKAREERRALAEMVRLERIENERRAKQEAAEAARIADEERKKREEEEAEERRWAAQAAADLARAERNSANKVLLARQKAALEARKAAMEQQGAKKVAGKRK